jgi:glycerol-3-phosphate O-acyltransferase
METLNTAYRDLIRAVVTAARIDRVINEHNVFQEGQKAVLPMVEQIAADLLLPASGIGGMEHLGELYEKAKTGASCLLLLEHYSNMDLTNFIYLLGQDSDKGREIADAVVAIAGMKLSEENPMVAALAAAYSRIIIYPSRSHQGLDPEKAAQEALRSNMINRAAMRALEDIKTRGHLILVFPSGTRYRPWDPASKRGVREIDSYIKIFDYMCLVAINGEVLHIRPGDMLDDSISRGAVRFTVAPIIPCAEFRASIRAGAVGVEDKKQAVVDEIMRRLEDIHQGTSNKLQFGM